MDPIEGCACCDALFDKIAKRFQLRVLRIPETWTHEYCVGLVDVESISNLCPINLMALNHTMGAIPCTGRFCLVVGILNNPYLAILHIRRPGKDQMRTTIYQPPLPPPPPTWQRGEERICMYDHHVLADLTRQISKDGFVYHGIPGSNLGQITSRDLHRHHIFDLTAWMDGLFKIDKYRVRGVWCYLNIQAATPSFDLEVVTDRNERKKTTTTTTAAATRSRRSICWKVYWFLFFVLGISPLASAVWVLFSLMPFWKGS